MRKICTILSRAAARLGATLLRSSALLLASQTDRRDIARLDPKEWGLLRIFAPSRCEAPSRGALLPRCAFLLAAAICSSALFPGCAKDDDAPAGPLSTAVVQLSVTPRAVGETAGAPTDAESRIYSLRVYAFVGGQSAGYYFTDNVTLSEAGLHTFFMDLTFYSDGEQTVDFYVVANEGAMSLRRASESSGSTSEFKLSETTSETELNGVWFNNMLRPTLETKGLPMFCRQSQMLDFTKLKTETPPAGSGHEDHTLLDPGEPIVFSLQRPMGKIGIFAAKPAGETSALHIRKLTMLANGTKVRNYLMPQSEATLQAVLSGGQDIDIGCISDPVGELSGADRAAPANYTPVMSQPFYPFENPWSHGGSWDIPGDYRGQVLKIEFAFDGGATRTGYIYLPSILRNQYLTVCCLISNEGQLKVEYSIADWTMESEYVIDFNYPTYTNPLMPASGSEPTEGPYPQPAVWFNSDENDSAGSYTFRFGLTGPTGQKWNPVMAGATEDDFEIEVYQILSGTKVVKYRYGGTKPSINDCVADPNYDFYITVRALKSENVGKTVSLGIAYDRSWSPGGSPLLLINGLTSDLKWAGSTIAEYVVIEQVDIPTVQKTDER